MIEPTSWRDHLDRATEAPDVPAVDEQPFYAPIGQFQGADYRRNAFAAGTDEEVATLRQLVPLGAGTRLLDVGCGDARHLRAVAGERSGVRAVGVEISDALAAAGREAAQAAGTDIEVLVGDARHLDQVLGDRMGQFDVAWSLCQGALGTSPATDPLVLAGLASAVRPGGTIVVTLFHALFAARHLGPDEAFDTFGLVHHQPAEVRGPDHARQTFDLWTASYTAREAVGLLTEAGLTVTSIRGVEPGGYGRRAPGAIGLDDPELLLVARKPA